MAISLLNLGVHGLLEKPFPVSSLTDLLDKKTESRIENSWRLDPSARRMTNGTEDIELTEVEFKVVSYLLGNLGKWIAREELV